MTNFISLLKASRIFHTYVPVIIFINLLYQLFISLLRYNSLLTITLSIFIYYAIAQYVKIQNYPIYPN